MWVFVAPGASDSLKLWPLPLSAPALRLAPPWSKRSGTGPESSVARRAFCAAGRGTITRSICAARCAIRTSHENGTRMWVFVAPVISHVARCGAVGWLRRPCQGLREFESRPLRHFPHGAREIARVP